MKKKTQLIIFFILVLNYNMNNSRKAFLELMGICGTAESTFTAWDEKGKPIHRFGWSLFKYTETHGLGRCRQACDIGCRHH